MYVLLDRAPCRHVAFANEPEIVPVLHVISSDVTRETLLCYSSQAPVGSQKVEPIYTCLQYGTTCHVAHGSRQVQDFKKALLNFNKPCGNNHSI